MKKALSLVLIVSLVAFSFLVFVPGAPAQASPDERLRYSDVIDVGPDLRAQEPTKNLIDLESLNDVGNAPGADASSSGSNGSNSATASSIGAVKSFLALNNATGRYYFKAFTLRAIGEKGEIWVANSLNYPAGDPRNPVVVTREQVDYLVGEFDTNIYPKEEAFFGTPNTHDGSLSLLSKWGYVPTEYYKSADGSARIMILVDNIRDASYYNPNYPFYIAGFYSSAIEAYTDRNIITIDAAGWATRLGPNTAPWRAGTDPNKWRPYMYEGTTAHEFQHLIHDDNDPAEENWINEGMSDFAEFLVGYDNPNTNGHINFFKDHPENSLVAWEDQGDLEILADYGIAYLFQLYLNDHYGGQKFIQALAKNPLQGIIGFENTLARFGVRKNFGSVYQEFAAALVVDSPVPGKIYEFKVVDLNVNTTTPEAYAAPGAPAWGTDFLTLTNDPKMAKFFLSGMDFLANPWQSVADPLNPANAVLWGNASHLSDNFLILPLSLAGQSAVALNFDTYFDIEEAWDYGFVQVSTDGGKTWTSLSNANTTDILDPNAHPKVAANVPGFTGWSGGWTNQTFDLSAYAGQDILLGFRYVTDWASLGNGHDARTGWYLDNVTVPELGLSYDGSTAAPFKSINEVLGQKVKYLVTFVGMKKNDKAAVQVKHVDPTSMTEADVLELKKMLNNSAIDTVLVLITHAAPVGDLTSADYTYSVEVQQNNRKK